MAQHSIIFMCLLWFRFAYSCGFLFDMEKDFSATFPLFVVVIFLLLRFISAQTMRGTSFRPSRYFFSFRLKGKERRRRRKVVVVVVVLPQHFGAGALFFIVASLATNLSK